MENKISAVYQIINTVTGDFYVGSSKDVKRRWSQHKRPSLWNYHLNSPLYRDMQKYGVEKFRFQILAPVMEEHLKDVEQEFIEMLKPTYNDVNAKGLDVERMKEWWQSDSGKEAKRKANRKYKQSEKGKESNRKYEQSDKRKECNRRYQHKLCSYNGETLTLSALAGRFLRAGIKNPVSEAKKYLMEEYK